MRWPVDGAKYASMAAWMLSVSPMEVALMRSASGAQSASSDGPWNSAMPSSAPSTSCISESALWELLSAAGVRPGSLKSAGSVPDGVR